MTEAARLRVAFDPQAFAMQTHGGVSRYFCRLAVALDAAGLAEVRVIAPLHINAHLAELPSALVEGRRVPRPPRGGRLLNAAALRLARRPLARFRPAIVHETYFHDRAWAPPGAARVVTVFDMIHERFPDGVHPRDRSAAWKAAAVKRADRVICISENTRRDLLAHLPLPPERVSVIPLGVDPVTPAATPPPERPYLLYVGQRTGYKNFEALLRAYAGAPALHGRFDLRCFGGGALSAVERRLAGELGLPGGRVSQTGGDDAALAAAYRDATLFVYPSRYEGFGLPPLEAMQQGCPVACANTSSLPEVTGDAADYFDPERPEAIRAVLERLLASPARLRELATRGPARAAAFGWDTCARATAAVYRAAAGWQNGPVTPA